MAYITLGILMLFAIVVALMVSHQDKKEKQQPIK